MDILVRMKAKMPKKMLNGSAGSAFRNTCPASPGSLPSDLLSSHANTLARALVFSAPTHSLALASARACESAVASSTRMFTTHRREQKPGIPSTAMCAHSTDRCVRVCRSSRLHAEMSEHATHDAARRRESGERSRGTDREAEERDDEAGEDRVEARDHCA
eukprot:212117-Rhodomonas_salina.1